MLNTEPRNEGGLVVLGRVEQLWRYPVKSMRGERVSRAIVERTYGIPGDRGWAIRDEHSGEIRGAKKIGALLTFAARYLEEPKGSMCPPAEITLPDGGRITTGDPAIDSVLSGALSRAVTLWPRRPADDVEHYRRVEKIDETEMRRQLGLLPDEPLPAYAAVPSKLGAQLVEFVSPLGTYFDAVELHLLTTASLASLASRSPGSLVDVRRFRPNIVIDTVESSGAFPEIHWCGRRFRIGSAVVEVIRPTSRCVMVTLPQAELAQDRKIMRTLVRETGMDLGVGLRVVEPGVIATGDTIDFH